MITPGMKINTVIVTAFFGLFFSEGIWLHEIVWLVKIIWSRWPTLVWLAS